MVASALVVIGCSESTPEDDPSMIKSAARPLGHQRMLKLLDGIVARLPNEGGDVGSAPLRIGEEQLAALPATGLDRQRISGHYLIGETALKLGDNTKARKHFEAVYELLPKVKNQLTKEKYERALLMCALTHLRIGEVENCVHGCTSDSCLLPIRGNGIHTRQAGSRQAIEYLNELLERNPNHLRGRWLLNIACMTIGGYPDDVPAQFLVGPEVFESDEPFPRFFNVSAELGLNTVSLSGGCIVDDFDDDGLLDVVASTTNPMGQLRYFHNDGTGTFTDQTDEAGLTGLRGGLNIIQADYDNDGDLDVLVLRGAWRTKAPFHPNSLLQNDGRGHFIDVTFDSGLGEFHYPTQTATWADFDNDGDLDLYIGNEKQPSQLFDNDGHGHFTDIARVAGVLNDRFTKGVVAGDFNGDRLPDIYVSNLEADNRLYRNNGDGTFTDVAPELNVTRPSSSFPTWFWDFNNDGHLDLWVGSCLWSTEELVNGYLGRPHGTEPDCLYQGDGNGGFREVAAQQNIIQVTHPMGCNFGDLDNDGFLDFYLGTGYPGYDGLMPNLMFHNRGGGGFSNVTTDGGFGHLQKGHGIAFADLDNDGDQDVFAELGGAYLGDVFANAVFENPGFQNNWIKIKLIGTRSNRCAIGARIRIEIDDAGTDRTVFKWVNSGGTFGANPFRQEIGIGKATRIKLLEIYWPTSDITEKFSNVAANQLLEITEGAANYQKRKVKLVEFPNPKPSIVPLTP